MKDKDTQEILGIFVLDKSNNREHDHETTAKQNHPPHSRYNVDCCESSPFPLDLLNCFFHDDSR